MRIFFLCFIVVMLAGCESKTYRDTQEGRFVGELDVRWVKNDYFLFLPNKDNPFAFVRKDDVIIKPGPMYTDGGSIPKYLWGIHGYSPWGYAPAYLVHDWLFEAHRCNHEPDNRFTFDDSVSVMAQGLKTIMEDSPEVRSYFVFDTIVASVGSPISKRLWDKGACEPPPFDMLAFSEKTPPGDLLMTIKFD
jgi:hypothetical protein